jgi:hypothetical protein
MKTATATQKKQIRQSDTLRIKICLVLAAANLLVKVAAHATESAWALDWFTVDGGGGTSSGNVYQVSGTIGQPDAGKTMTGGSYSLDGGFWGIVAVEQTPGAPMLSMRRNSPTKAIVSWPYPSTGFVLQETSNLDSPNWSTHIGTTSNDRNNNYIVVNTSAGNRFYRLKKVVTTVPPSKADSTNQ